MHTLYPMTMAENVNKLARYFAKKQKNQSKTFTRIKLDVLLSVSFNYSFFIRIIIIQLKAFNSINGNLCVHISIRGPSVCDTCIHIFGHIFLGRSRISFLSLWLFFWLLPGSFVVLSHPHHRSCRRRRRCFINHCALAVQPSVQYNFSIHFI